MPRYVHLWIACCLLLTCGAARAYDIRELAKEHAGRLRLSTYMTAGTVKRLLAAPEEERAEAAEQFRRLGITKVYLEVYRGGTELSEIEMRRSRDSWAGHGFGVTGGIATVPGGDFGVEADVGLHWFNFQNPKTQRDLERVMRAAARVFDTFIVDDFLCTGDRSVESKAAMRGRSWADYRRDLMTVVSQRVFLDPAREENPDITMIVKFPQWYDRFHLFGYDVERMPQLFDQVWVGTETRGARTQRFGFVPPYEGFINYRWLAGLSGGKIAGAWFDHGDCDGPDFLDQAWHTVLAGAKEIVIFNAANVLAGHPGHALLANDFERLAGLAMVAQACPVEGPAGYKPPHSDAGGDLYIMDFIGMLGTSLVPQHTFPADARTIFLPTQAAADPRIAEKTLDAAKRGVNLVFTTGFLATVADPDPFLELAGLKRAAAHQRLDASELVLGNAHIELPRPIRLGGALIVEGAMVDLVAETEEGLMPVVTTHQVGDGRVCAINVRTFSQADFDAVGEVLLAPRPLALMDLPREAAAVFRRAFAARDEISLDAPAGVSFQLIEEGGAVFQNVRDEAIDIAISLPEHAGPCWFDFKGDVDVIVEDGVARATLPTRGRLWLISPSTCRK